MWNLQQALGEISGLPHVCLQPSAGSHGELAGVLLTRAYHEDRGETRHKVLTPDTAHGTNPATVTMAGLEVVKLATERRRRRRPRRPAREGRRGRRLPDADQPEHARAVRPQHRGDRRDRPRRGRDALLRRREPERGDGPLTARRHGLRHRALQPAQVLHPAARRRRPRLGADRGVRADRALPAASRRRRARTARTGARRRSPWKATAPSRSGACAASTATTAASCAPTPTSARSARDGLRDASEAAVLNANYLLARLREHGRRRASAARLRRAVHARVRRSPAGR